MTPLLDTTMIACYSVDTRGYLTHHGDPMVWVDEGPTAIGSEEVIREASSLPYDLATCETTAGSERFFTEEDAIDYDGPSAEFQRHNADRIALLLKRSSQRGLTIEQSVRLEMLRERTRALVAHLNEETLEVLERWNAERDLEQGELAAALSKYDK